MALGKVVKEVRRRGTAGEVAEHLGWALMDPKNPQDLGLFLELPNYAGDIAQAWPIIVHYKINIAHINNEMHGSCFSGGQTGVAMHKDGVIAAMRAFVYSFLGEEVDLP